MKDCRINKRAVDAMTCADGLKKVIYFDDQIRGFGVVVRPSGRKTFILQLRLKGDTQRHTIGVYGRITPDEARVRAKQMVGEISKGFDFSAAKKAAREEMTFAEAVEIFFDEHGQNLSATTVDGYRSALRAHVMCAIGAKRISEIKRDDCITLHKALKSTPCMANKCLDVIAAIWNWHIDTREDESFVYDPTRKVKRYPELGREVFLNYEQIQKIGEVLREAETSGLPYRIDEEKSSSKHTNRNRLRKICPYATCAIRLYLLTGCRRNEILHARWAHFDRFRGLLNLPDTKTGKRSIILPPPAVALIESLPRVDGNPFIMPGNVVGRPRYDMKKPWAAIAEAAGLEGVRLHDLRHTFASVGVSNALGLQVVGQILGHTQIRTTQRYGHLENSVVRKASTQIGDIMSGYLAPSKAPTRWGGFKSYAVVAYTPSSVPFRPDPAWGMT